MADEAQGLCAKWMTIMKTPAPPAMVINGFKCWTVEGKEAITLALRTSSSLFYFRLLIEILVLVFLLIGDGLFYISGIIYAVIQAVWVFFLVWIAERPDCCGPKGIWMLLVALCLSIFTFLGLLNAIDWFSFIDTSFFYLLCAILYILYMVAQVFLCVYCWKAWCALKAGAKADVSEAA